MKAYYLNERGQILSLPIEFHTKNNKGFAVTEQHHLIGVVDDAGNFVIPADLERTDFEDLFINKHVSAPVLDYAPMFEKHKGGFRLTEFRTDEQVVYTVTSSVGSVKQVADPNTGVTEMYHRFDQYVATSFIPCYIYDKNTFQYEKAADFDRTIENKLAMGANVGRIILPFWVGDEFHSTLVALEINADYSGNWLTSAYQTYETYRNDNETLGILFYFGQAAENRLNQLSLAIPVQEYGLESK